MEKATDKENKNKERKKEEGSQCVAS